MYPGGWVYTPNWGRMCTRIVHKCAPECAQMCARIGQNVTPKHPPGARGRPPQQGGDPGPMCGLRTPLGQGEDPPGARRRPPPAGGVTLGQCAALGNPPGGGLPPWGKGKNVPRWVGVHPQIGHECVPECAQMCTRMYTNVYTNVCRNGSKSDPETPPWGKAKTPCRGVTLGQCAASGPPGARGRPPQQGGDPGPMCGLRTPLGQGETPPAGG